jgi:DNA-binding Xre family transcriptional regulator
MNYKELNKIISYNIKKYMNINNSSVSKLYKQTGIPLNILKKIENNTISREITIQEIHKISKSLNVTVNKLLENTYDQ